MGGEFGKLKFLQATFEQKKALLLKSHFYDCGKAGRTLDLFDEFIPGLFLRCPWQPTSLSDQKCNVIMCWFVFNNTNVLEIESKTLYCEYSDLTLLVKDLTCRSEISNWSYADKLS